MKITDFGKIISSLEEGKKNLSIAQIMEVLKCINIATDGDFYKLVRKMP